MIIGFRLRGAASKGSSNTVQDLVRSKEHKNNPVKFKQSCNSDNVFGWTALHRCAENGHENVCDYLLKLQEGQITEVDAVNWNKLLFGACCNGQVKASRTLLEAGADLNLQDYQGWSPLHVASRHGHTGIVKMLLGKGAKIDLRSNHLHQPRGGGKTALELANIWGNKETVEIVRSAGS